MKHMIRAALVALLILMLAASAHAETSLDFMDSLALGIDRDDARARICGYDAYDADDVVLRLAVSTLAMNERHFTAVEDADYAFAILSERKLSEDIEGYSMFAYCRDGERVTLRMKGYYFQDATVFNTVEALLVRRYGAALQSGYSVASDSEFGNRLREKAEINSYDRASVWVLMQHGRPVVLEHISVGGLDLVVYSMLEI